uniref:LRRCT domain-containing protein n=1 Tax=Ornithorhynchus anatinus TaxID=9258 RepID=A0A6I8PDK4_ORNAN
MAGSGKGVRAGVRTVPRRGGSPPPWSLLCLLCLLVPPAGPCPFRGFCVGTPGRLRCSPATLRGPPPALPPDARNLTIVGGNLSVLHRAFFASTSPPAPALPLLRTLRLTHDLIEAVEDGAFLGLPSLATLDLSHNPLRTLASGAFGELPALRSLHLSRALHRGGPELAGQLDDALRPLSRLRRLDLAQNGLARLPPAALRLQRLERLDARANALPGLDAVELELLRARDGAGGEPGVRASRDEVSPPGGRPPLTLVLAANPLRCDCRTRALLAWLRRAPWRVPDASALRCAAPRALSGAALLALPDGRLSCPDEGAPEREDRDPEVGDGEARGPEAEDDLEAEDLEARQLEAYDPEAQELKVRDPEAQELEAYDPEAQELKVRDPEDEDPEAQDLKALELKVRDLEDQDLEVQDPEAQELKVRDLEDEDLEAQDPEAQDPKAQGLKVQDGEDEDLEAQDLESQNLKAQDPEAQDLKAQDPEAHDPEAHDPEAQDLEASYVFFGLVLALIGGVFMLVLYLNRRGLQRWLATVRAACRDQMEGYHYRYGQDGEPGRP